MTDQNSNLTITAICMRPAIVLTLILCLSGQILKAQQSNEDDTARMGAVIVVSVEGKASMILDDEDANAVDLKPGTVLAAGDFIVVETASKVMLLFSNGTLVTAQEGTEMAVGVFEQEPFEAVGGKVEDLESEPSSSKVEIDLDIGSLVVKTKKLNKKSSFDINSPLGTAGIRGTEFQMGIDAGGGMQLDVTESTVAFTPPGGSPTPVSQGQGLDVSSTGAVATRPVNPVVAQNVQTTNEVATQASAEIKIETVANAMSEATVKSSGSSGKSSPEARRESRRERKERKQAAGNRESKGGKEQRSRKSPPKEATPSEPKVDEILENNQDAKQTRKTGKSTGASASQLAKFGFNQSQLEKFYKLPESVQNSMIAESPDKVLRLIDMEGFSPDKAVVLFSYGPEARAKVMQLDDSRLLSLLGSEMEESMILDLLSQQNLSQSSPDNLPNDGPSSSLSDQVLALGDELREDGNIEVFEEVEVLNGGEWTEEWIAVAKVGNSLTRDLNFLSDFSSLEPFSAGETLGNPFFDDLASLYEQMLIDQMDAGNDPVVIGGAVISLGAESYDFSEMIGDKSGLLIGATDRLNLQGKIEVGVGEKAGVRTVLASGGAIEVSAGTSVRSALSDLVVAAREDVLLQEVALESAREVAVRSLRDLQLAQVAITAADRVHLRASRNLEINGLELSQSLPSLIMEATTIRLSNIDFPSATAVQLNSLKGPIDGRYPNFGTSIPASEQLGRVNFIENVRSGGNLMNDRPSFDQFGGNISIGKLTNP